MSEENTSVDQNDPPEIVPAGKVDPFEEMETERHREFLPDNKPEEPIKDKAPKTKEPTESIKEKTEVAEEEGEEGNDTSELEQLKNEAEKSKKSLLDAQKWGTKNSQKVKYALKKLNVLIENGSFTEDEEKEALNLKQMLESDTDAPFEDDKATNANQHPISKYLDIASEKLVVMKELSDDPESFHKKYRAFEISLLDYKPDEIELLADELDELKNNPVKLAKKIMDIADQYYNEYYKEFEETGGFRKIIEKRNKEEKKLKNEIDKLKKKLLTYEDFDKPKYRIGEDHSIASEDESSDSSADPFEQMEESRALMSKNRR